MNETSHDEPNKSRSDPGQGQPAPGADRGSRSWPLERRLMIPIALLVVGTTIALSVHLTRYISSRMDLETDARLARIAETLAESGFAVERNLLKRLRDVANVHVVIIGPSGDPLISTLEGGRSVTLRERVQAGDLEGHVMLAGEKHRYVSRSGLMLGRVGPSVLVVAASTAETDRLKRDVAWTIGLALATALILMIAIAHFVVRAATRPLAALASAARQLGRGTLDERVPGGGGREIDALAEEFNAMTLELERSRRELVRAEKLAVAGRLAASVAHEVRNPLSSLRMKIQLILRRSAGDRAVAARLGELLEEIDRLDLSLGNLLDLSTLDARPREHGSLAAAARSVVSLAAEKLQHLKIRVSTELPSGLPQVLMDETRVRQAILNVVLNAANAMPAGGRLRVCARCDDSSVELVIEDDGVGLDPGIAGRAFEPFVSGRRKGAGLGLYVVRQVIEGHGGSVRLEPMSPRGTRCVITLPAATPRQRAVDAAARRSA